MKVRFKKSNGEWGYITGLNAIGYKLSLHSKEKERTQ